MSLVRVRIDGRTELLVALRSDETPSVRWLLEALPFRSTANRWGDEIYFDAPFHAALEDDARADMSVGEVAFWPDGDAIAMFFGPTPVSVDGRPRAYSPCNILGRVEGDPAKLRVVSSGASVEVLPS